MSSSKLPWEDIRGGNVRTSDNYRLGVIKATNQDNFTVLVEGLIPVQLVFQHTQVAMSMHWWGGPPIVELALTRAQLVQYLANLRAASAKPIEAFDTPVVWTNDEVTFA